MSRWYDSFYEDFIGMDNNWWSDMLNQPKTKEWKIGDRVTWGEPKYRDKVGEAATRGVIVYVGDTEVWVKRDGQTKTGGYDHCTVKKTSLRDEPKPMIYRFTTWAYGDMEAVQVTPRVKEVLTAAGLI